MTRVLTYADLSIGGRYNWKGQPERLIYMGRALYPGDYRNWHQFELVDNPGVCWCEVLDSDLQSFELTEQKAGSMADLNGTPRPGDLPSVGTEDARLALTAALGYVERNTPQLVRDEIRSLAAERDKLAERVAKLEVDARRLDWLDKNAGHHTVHVGGRWYVRRDYSAQHVRAGNLRAAIDAAITGASK